MHQGTIRNGTFAPRSHLSGSVLQKRPQELTQPRLCYSGEFTADFRRMRGRKWREPVDVRGSERGQLIDSFKDRWEDHSRLHAHGKKQQLESGKGASGNTKTPGVAQRSDLTPPQRPTATLHLTCAPVHPCNATRHADVFFRCLSAVTLLLGGRGGSYYFH